MDNDLYIRKRLNELHPDLSNLVSKLVGFGGNTVNIPYDSLNKRIFLEGVIYKNKAKPHAMNRELCHKNVFSLHTQHGWSLHSGYVLGKNNAWYRHSWCLNDNNEIIETSYPKATKLYYGIPLNEQEFLEMMLLMGQVHITIGTGLRIASPFKNAF